MNRQRFWAGTLAIIVGCLVNYLGDRVIGVRIELFWGLQTFNFLWFLQLFIWPVVVGISVSAIFGLGGKWLCYFPPFIVRSVAYFETQYLIGIPQGAELMPVGWWLFYVILAVECAAIGGVLGEIWIKRIYGRTSPEDAKRKLIQPGQNQPEAGSNVDELQNHDSGAKG
ncbi:MAG: hypothetical protein OEZ68_16760 [Gammaproteobacteria bacterium]|nr:hypothetical protein [Gammaproteobacteria bacterium]MDH5802455.1 hypothetical protein [Gammaproteobacteria bacterium]